MTHRGMRGFGLGGGRVKEGETYHMYMYSVITLTQHNTHICHTHTPKQLSAFSFENTVHSRSGQGHTSISC